MNLYQIRNILATGKKLIELPLRVTFYARVSTDYEEQLNSLENQVMYFENYIKSQDNWTFVPGYVDEGISGTSVNKRDNFLKINTKYTSMVFRYICLRRCTSAACTSSPEVIDLYTRIIVILLTIPLVNSLSQPHVHLQYHNFNRIAMKLLKI